MLIMRLRFPGVCNFKKWNWYQKTKKSGEGTEEDSIIIILKSSRKKNTLSNE